MVLLLVLNVPNYRRHLGPADAAREIPLLPFKPHSGMVIHPSRRICLQHLHGLRYAESWPHLNKSMCVVLDACDGDRVHAMSFCDTRLVRPQFRLEGFRNYLEAVFRAEHDMDVVAYVGAGHCAVPFGTRLIILSLPGTAVPGYRLFRPCETASLIAVHPLLTCAYALLENTSSMGRRCRLVAGGRSFDRFRPRV
jgi:hypothetical protein